MGCDIVNCKKKNTFLKKIFFCRTWVLFVGPLIHLLSTYSVVSCGSQSLVEAYTFPEIHLWWYACGPLCKQSSMYVLHYILQLIHVLEPWSSAPLTGGDWGGPIQGCFALNFCRMMAALKDVVATSNVNLCFNLGHVIERPGKTSHSK